MKIELEGIFSHSTWLYRLFLVVFHRFLLFSSYISISTWRFGITLREGYIKAVMELPGLDAAGIYLYVVAIILFLIPVGLFASDWRSAVLGDSTPECLKLPPATKIVQLWIYPIKSCRGFQVQSTIIRKDGLDLDRYWMFIDANTREFLTIRQIKEMTLIDTSLSEEDELVVSLRTDLSVKFAIPAHPSEDWLKENTTLRTDNKIWNDRTDGWEYSADLTAPLSKFFKRDVRLLYKGPTPRLLRGNGDEDHLGRSEHVNFPDLMPVQVSSLASLAELNTRLKKAGVAEDMSIERFRPNIVVRGGKPWAEDVWKTVRIIYPRAFESGLQKFLTLDVVARCARCQVPNVDPDTAEKDKHEPWDTLMKYRRVDDGIKWKPCFGMLCCPREEGEVSVGQTFVVTKVTQDHKYIPVVGGGPPPAGN